MIPNSDKTWLVAVDLDGTLFGDDHQISPRTARVLHAVADRGHSIVVVTGRSSFSAIARLTAIPSNARVLCSNGAYEYDRDNAKIHWSQTLSAQHVIALRQKLLNAIPSASFGWESELGLGFEQQFINEAGGAHTLEQGGGITALGQSDVFKLYMRTPKLVREALQRKVLSVLDDEAEVSSSGAPFVELTARGVDKASGLARVAADLGFTAASIVAFGDNQNDLPMLNWAGVGVAMGNALPDVKAIADTHTLSNVDEGVADYLERQLLGL